jgi:HEPN domain-containing protein
MRPEALEWAEKAEGDFRTATREAAVDEHPNFDAVCFHCQQSAEKYLKALLTEHGVYFPKTHDLEVLLRSASTIGPQTASLAQATKTLTIYSIDVRYPGSHVSRDEALQALGECVKIRETLREILKLQS